MSKVKTLTFTQQVQILRVLAQLADHADAYRSALIAAGYKSFLAWEEFERSFCDPDESDLHKRCLIERMKSHIETPDGVSPRYNEQLQHDPCFTRRAQMEIENRFLLEERRTEMHSSFIRYRTEELAYMSTSKNDSDVENYASQFGSILIDAFRPLGFDRDTFRSTTDFPVVSKSINPDWDICWSPESNRTLRWLPRGHSGDIYKMSILDLQCYVRSKGARGFVNVPVGFKCLDIMPIRVQFLECGFGWAYSRFDGIEELPVVINAHAFIYKLVAGEIEKSLLFYLDSLTG